MSFPTEYCCSGRKHTAAETAERQKLAQELL
jgi:hypothetical protein